MSSRAKKIDDNQRSIVRALREMPGITISLDHDDLLIGYRKRNFWVEVKNPDRCLNKDGELLESALRPSQKKLQEEWEGQYMVAWNLQQILDTIGYVDIV